MRSSWTMSDKLLTLLPTVVFLRRKVCGLGLIFGSNRAVDLSFGGCVWVQADTAATFWYVWVVTALKICTCVLTIVVARGSM